MEKNVTARDLHDLEKRVYDLERANTRSLDDMRVFRDLIRDILARIRPTSSLARYGTTDQAAIRQAEYDDPHYRSSRQPGGDD